MRSPRKTTALALAGAVGLSSAAYGIGTQTGDGTAAARDEGAPSISTERHHYPGRGFDALAEELGVSADRLHDALRDYHDQEREDGRAAFLTALARALGKPADEVQSALGQLRPRAQAMCSPHRDHAVPLRQLANALDVSRAELREALRDVRAGAQDGWEDRREDLVEFLAERLELPADEVEAALPEFLGRGPGGPGPPPGP